MLHAQPAKKALQSLPRARRFSSTPAPAAVSPYRRAAQAQAQQTPRRNVSDTATRSAAVATAAATSPQRAVPSPAFNRDDNRWRDVQPLQPYRQPEMDHSFVGMTGGAIFHEMMLRQGVKHVCELMRGCEECVTYVANAVLSWLPRWCYPPRLRCDLQQQTLRLHSPPA